MAIINIKAENLSIGDALCLPFNKTATVTDVKSVGSRTQYVRFRTEFGWTRVEVGSEVSVER